MGKGRGAVLLLAIASANLLGCGGGNTTFQSTWRDPGLQSIKFTKVLAVAISKEPGLRRSFEDEMVRVINASGQAQAAAAYTLLSADELRDADKARTKVQIAGFDGVVTMRVVGVDKEQRLVGGSPAPAAYASPWGYYRYGWGATYDPGYLVTDKQVQIETNIYSLAQNKLVWSGRSQTTNPSSAAALADDMARAVGDELRKQGLLPPKNK